MSRKVTPRTDVVHPTEKPKHKTKFQLRRERTYEELIRSANTVFSTKGYTAATIDDIVAGTPYTRGAFYFHFEDKRSCFLDVIAKRQALRSTWTEVPYELDPKATSIEDIVTLAVQRMNEPTVGERPLVLAMVDFFQANRDETDIAETLSAVHRNWIWEITRFVEGLKERGWISTSRPSREIANHLLATGEGLAVHQILYGIDAGLMVVPNILAILAWYEKG